MFNNILFYLVIGLSASTMGFGYLSYHLRGVNAELELGLVQAIDVNTGLVKSLNLRDLSCKIDIKDTLDVEAEKKDLQTKTSLVSDKIEKLRKPQDKQEITKNENLKETNVLPDDGLLSANLTGMLREGFCSVEPSDNLCRTP